MPILSLGRNHRLNLHTRRLTFAYDNWNCWCVILLHAGFPHTDKSSKPNVNNSWFEAKAAFSFIQGNHFVVHNNSSITIVPRATSRLCAWTSAGDEWNLLVYFVLFSAHDFFSFEEVTSFCQCLHDIYSNWWRGMISSNRNNLFQKGNLLKNAERKVFKNFTRQPGFITFVVLINYIMSGLDILVN